MAFCVHVEEKEEKPELETFLLVRLFGESQLIFRLFFPLVAP